MPYVISWVDTCFGVDTLPLTAAGWSSLVARRAHNPKVAGSNPAPAIKADHCKGLGKPCIGRLRPEGRPPGRPSSLVREASRGSDVVPIWEGLDGGSADIVGTWPP